MERNVDRLEKKQHVIIYGANLSARNVNGWLERHRSDVCVLGYAVTSLKNNPTEIGTKRVCLIEDWTEEKERCVVIVATPHKFIRTIEKHLDELGFKRRIFMPPEKIAVIQGDELKELFSSQKRLCFLEDKKDFEYANLYDGAYKLKLSVLNGIPYGEKEKRLLFDTDWKQEYEKKLGSLKRITKDSLNKTVGISKTYTIYRVVSHLDRNQSSFNKKQNHVMDIQAGKAKTDLSFPCMHDNVGENISDRNDNYAEMTAMYWIWKNALQDDYVGLCHYRRLILMDRESMACFQDARGDALLMTPRIALPNIIEAFIRDTTLINSDIEALCQTVKALYPECINEFLEYLSGNLYYPCNILLVRKEIFSTYCQWIFSILFAIEKKNKKKRNDRYLAYMAEILTSFYFIFYKNQMKIFVTDYQFIS